MRYYLNKSAILILNWMILKYMNAFDKRIKKN